MENAKDTFYITLRNRLTSVNPNRTMLLRAVRRPGILVEEAEAPVAEPAAAEDVAALIKPAPGTVARGEAEPKEAEPAPEPEAKQKHG